MPAKSTSWPAHLLPPTRLQPLDARLALGRALRKETPRYTHAGSRLLTGYMGKSIAFEDALARFAQVYADQNERYHAALISSGREGCLEAQPGVLPIVMMVRRGRLKRKISEKIISLVQATPWVASPIYCWGAQCPARLRRLP